MKYKKIQLIFVIIVIGMVSLTGCFSAQSDVYHDLKKDISADEKKKSNNINIEANSEQLKGTLTVTTCFDDYMFTHAQNFMAIHPDVIIEIITPKENEFETLETYSKRVSTELMSGTASDLVDLSSLDTNRYAKSGLLCNLYEFMDKDASFNQSDYYTNIFNAMEYDDALYSMPFAFQYDMVYISKNMTEKLGLDSTSFKSIKYKQMLDIYRKAKKKAKKQHSSPQNFHIMPGIVKESFFKHEFIEFYDVKTGTAWFDSDDFLKYLNSTCSIETGYSPDYQGQWNMSRIGDGNDDFMKSDFMFSKYESNAIDLYNLMINYENVLGPVPFLNSAGNAPFSTFSATYAIPQNSQKKELAWKFLKYCVSAKKPSDFENEGEELHYFMMYQGWIPINIENFYTSFEQNFKMEIGRINESQINVSWKLDDMDILINNTLDEIHRWNFQRDRLVSDFQLWTLLKSDLENYYYYDLVTAEEIADIIQDKVLTYLNE